MMEFFLNVYLNKIQPEHYVGSAYCKWDVYSGRISILTAKISVVLHVMSKRKSVCLAGRIGPSCKMFCK